MAKDDKIVVFGATGQQGGAVMQHLLATGYTNVHAFVRPSENEKAKALEEKGVKLVVGDLDDPMSLDKAIEGAYGVFSVMPLDIQNIEIEVSRGKAVADAAKKASVKHFVYSSVGGAHRGESIPHFKTKYTIEQYVHELGLPASIVRPSAFMENFITFMRPQLQDGTAVFRQAMKADTKLQMNAVTDIGRVVADMFEHPDKFIGKTLEIAGDELTFPQIAEAYQKATGRPARFEEQPIEEVRAFSDDMAAMYVWFNEEGYSADIAKLRADYPELLSFEAWLKQYAPAIAPQPKQEEQS